MLAGMLIVLIPLSGYSSGNENSEVEGKIPEAEVAKQPFIEYNNRMAVFNLDHQVYERTKPNAFYVGVEAWKHCLKKGKWDENNYQWPLLFNKTYRNTLNEIELRMGYNFFFEGRAHFTPFAGVGYLKNSINYSYYDKTCACDINSFYNRPRISYGTIGYLYDYEIADVFALGANLKGILGVQNLNRGISSDRLVKGFDVAFPITFRFGYKRHWDLRIEPFRLFFKGNDVYENCFGFRSTIGYRF